MAGATGYAWRNPRWSSLVGPDADTLAAIFEDLSAWLANPTFNNGITIGNGGNPSVSNGRKVPPAQVTWTAANIGGAPTLDTTAPAAVSGLTLTPGVQTILARWTANSDDDVKDGHGTYVVEISPEEDFSSILDTHEVGGTVTVFDGLSTGTTYYVRVKARDYSGNMSEEWSTVESAVPVEVAGVDIADLSITEAKLGNSAVTASKIAEAAVEVSKIADGAVSSAKIQTGAVLTEKLGDLAVTLDKLANNAVDTSKLVDGAVEEAKIATSAITETKIANDAITTPKIAAGAVTANEIAANTIVAGNIAAGAVGTDELAANAVTAAKIAANTITANEIAAGAITSSELAAGAVVAGKIAAGSIVAADIATNTITAKQLALVSFDNLIQNPGFEASDSSFAPHAQEGGGGGLASIVTTASRSGNNSLKLAASASDAYLILNGPSGAWQGHIPCSEGDKFYFEFWVRRESAGSAPNTIIAEIQFRSRQNTVLSTATGTSAVPADETWTKYSVSGTAPAGAAYLLPLVHQNDGAATGAVLLDDFYMRRMATAELIVDGTITGTKIAAATIEGGNIAANTITAGNIAANTITAAEIQSGTITSSELAANSVTAAKLAAVNIEAGKYIRSTTYSPGTSGWTIEADGTAEFNNVVVRGNLAASTIVGDLTMSTGGRIRTAASGQRVEISSSTGNKILLFSGAPSDTDPPSIRAEYPTSDMPALILSAGSRGGYSGSSIEIVSTAESGLFVGGISLKAPGSVRIEGPNWTSTSVSIIGTLSTTAQIAAGGPLVTPTLQTDSLQPFNGLSLRSTGQPSSFIDWFYNGSTSVRVITPALNRLQVEPQQAGQLDFRLFNAAAIAGTTMVINGTSWQVGPTSSKRELKENIRDLGDAEGVWALRPVRFNWREGEGMLGNAAEINKLHPNGVAGLIIEEVAEVLPDAVHVDEDGNPVGFDDQVIRGYLVAAIQELKAEIEELKNER